MERQTVKVQAIYDNGKAPSKIQTKAGDSVFVWPNKIEEWGIVVGGEYEMEWKSEQRDPQYAAKNMLKSCNRVSGPMGAPASEVAPSPGAKAPDGEKEALMAAMGYANRNCAPGGGDIAYTEACLVAYKGWKRFMEVRGDVGPDPLGEPF